MATKLDRLIESIDPMRTLNKVSADVDGAINSFSMNRATIKDWNEYQEYLAGFARHIEKIVLRMGSGVPDNKEFYWARCSNILDKRFGRSGFKTAFEMVMSGKDGGLYRILKTIAEEMAENYAGNEISARVNRYWSTLSIDEKLAAADEYKDKYGHLLPSEFTAGNGARLKAHFPQILEEHPKMIQRMRRVGR